ncbi:MAG TPA: hypothetical protein VMS08_04320 [Candidatus Saccharimonadia bacterium]|nr:hypothetical protein [Candidatus Saccharimonadia bacterium]
MRFGKIAQFAIGFAAASGAFVLLSSNALAADAGSATTPQKGFDATAVAPVQQVTQSDQSSGDTGTAAAQPTANDGPPTAGGTSSSVQQSDTSSSSSSTISSSSNSSMAIIGASDSGKPTSGLTGGVSSDPTTPTNSATTVSGAGANEAQSSAGAPTASQSAFADNSSTSPTSSLPTAVLYRSDVLAIQPTIVNHTVFASDLASLIPTASTPSKLPVPAKSNGGLERLTSVLAGAVVPPSFFPSVLPVDRLKLLLSLVTLVVLLANLVVLSYGLWLRKGGFATAARSDSPVTNSIYPFATPFLLGYVSAPPRIHSPSLVVSDYKIRKTLFATLSERRTSI